jgi:hypothetical protein
MISRAYDGSTAFDRSDWVNLAAKRLVVVDRNGAVQRAYDRAGVEIACAVEHSCMVIAVVTMSPFAVVNVSCISAEKPTSLSIQLASPTIVRFPSLVIVPKWVALPVPAVVAVLGLVNVIVPSSPSRKGRFSEALAAMALSASAARSGRIVEFLE